MCVCLPGTISVLCAATVIQPSSRFSKTKVKIPCRSAAGSPVGLTWPVRSHLLCTSAASVPTSRTRGDPILMTDSGKIFAKPNAWAARILVLSCHHRPTTLTNSASSANKSARASASAAFHARSQPLTTSTGLSNLLPYLVSYCSVGSEHPTTDCNPQSERQNSKTASICSEGRCPRHGVG